MAPSIIEKYEQILAADPRSRIFVELAKALVDRGDHARAVEVCRRGLEHHPSSILGRVIWGRALLEGGDPSGALEQFEIAIAIEPSSPYAFNLIGEALIRKGMWREALPVLARAVDLQPADARVRGWLAEAMRQTKGNGAAEGAATADEKAWDPFRATAARAAGNGAVAAMSTPAPTATSTGTATPAATADQPAREQSDGTETASPPANGAPPPLRRPPATPPPRAPREVTDPRFVLSMLPGSARDEIGPRAGPARPARATDAAEAERIAAQYEKDLRKRLMSEPEPPGSLLRRHRRAFALAGIAIAAAAGLTVFLVVRARSRAAEAATAVEAARRGIARDTFGALRQASEILGRAREVRGGDPEILSLSAQVAALLATDYGDETARETARRIADEPGAGDGALVARLLLAEKPAERAAAEAKLLSAPAGASPLVQAIAGEVLLRRGEGDAARGRLEVAARSTPPLLRALADLGDTAMKAGDAEDALASYLPALSAVATHARSAIGAAEARLALDRDLGLARKSLAAVDADPGNRLPETVRLRFELAYAKVLARTGDTSAAVERLSRAAEKLGRSAILSGTIAELQLAARAYDRAEAEAARAVQAEPKEVAWKVLLARARIGRGRFAEALAATEGADGRAVRIQRAAARYGLRQYAGAKAELEKTAHEGKMPAEAAVWYALCDIALGRAAKARPILERLAASRTSPPLALVALGRADEAQGKPEDAERQYRAAVERDPLAPEGHAALGALLLAGGRAKEAEASLAQAVKLDPFALDVRRSLGEARLAAGKASAARAELDAVLLQRPRDGAALRILSAAWLAEKQPAEAVRAAERAVSAEPGAPSYLAAARANLAAGDRAAARRAAERAAKLAGKGPAGEEARQLMAEAGAKRR